MPENVRVVEPGGPAEIWVERPARLFSSGDYPDKGVFISPDHLDSIVALSAAQAEIPLDLSPHGNSDVNLPASFTGGIVPSSIKRVENFLDGVIRLPEKLYSALRERYPDRIPLSVVLDRATKAIKKVAVVPKGRVPDAAFTAGDLCFADSGEVAEPAVDSTSMQAVLDALAAAGLKLPDDTTEANLKERIVVAGTAVKGTQEPTDKGEDVASPIAMSDDLPVVDTERLAREEREERTRKAVMKFLTDSGVSLPEDTTSYNLFERIVGALKATNPQAEFSMTNIPNVTATAVGDADKPITFADPDAGTTGVKLPRAYRQMIRKAYAAQISSHVQRRAFPPKAADELLAPLLGKSAGDFTFALDDSGEAKHELLDFALSLLERIPDNAIGTGPVAVVERALKAGGRGSGDLKFSIAVADEDVDMPHEFTNNDTVESDGKTMTAGQRAVNDEMLRMAGVTPKGRTA